MPQIQINDELERVLKDSIVEIFRHLPGVAEQNQHKPQWDQLVQLDEFERGISCYEFLSVLSSWSSEKMQTQANKSGDAPNVYSRRTWHKSRSIGYTYWETFIVSISRGNSCS